MRGSRTSRKDHPRFPRTRRRTGSSLHYRRLPLRCSSIASWSCTRRCMNRRTGRFRRRRNHPTGYSSRPASRNTIDTFRCPHKIGCYSMRKCRCMIGRSRRNLAAPQRNLLDRTANSQLSTTRGNCRPVHRYCTRSADNYYPRYSIRCKSRSLLNTPQRLPPSLRCSGKSHYHNLTPLPCRSRMG